MKRITAVILVLAVFMTGIQLSSIISLAEESDISRDETLSGDAMEDEIEESVDEFNEEDIESEYAEEAEQNELLDLANSWRYTNGQPKEEASEYSGRMRSRAYHPNATKVGIDVSEWNGQIDWEKVKAAGIDFAIIRCGYGMDYTSQDDDYWFRNVSECERLGIPYGVYIYSYATNTERALSEAQHVLRLISGHNLTYPVYFDMEDDTTLGCDLTAIAKTFCNTISSAGYAVGVYANTNWWNNYLTDSCFGQWHRWVAEWGSTCNYGGEYAIWQYTSDGAVDGIEGRVDMNYLIGYPANHGTVGEDELSNAISSSAHVQDIGWTTLTSNGNVVGLVGGTKQIEAIRVKIDSTDEVDVEYQTYVQDEGWQEYVGSGEVSGTTGENRCIEALRIRLIGEDADKYKLYYRAYVRDEGWLDWAENGMTAGTIGYSLPIDAYQVTLIKSDEEFSGDMEMPCKYRDNMIKFRACVGSEGWQENVINGEICGTTGQNKAVRAFSIEENIEDIDIRYSGYIQDSGWQEYVSNGEVIGNTSESKQLEAIKIEITGEKKEEYNIFYRVHVSNIGWMGWTQDGGEAGTNRYGYAIEAIQVLLLPSNSDYAPAIGQAFMKKPMSVLYQTHVSNIGWQSWSTNGETAGTTGRNLGVEALKVQLDAQDCDGDIEYSAHVQDIGWQDYVQNGAMAGTEGLNKPIEAIRIRMSGELRDKYDVYYRVHASEFGWLGWAMNGEEAGSEGYARKIEALEIQLVEKGQAAPGSTENAFVKKGTIVKYSAHVENIGWQGYVENGSIAGTTGKNLQIEALKIMLQNKGCSGEIECSAHVADIGWQEFVSENNISGTVGKNKQIEAVKIRLTDELQQRYDVYYRVHASEFGWLGWAKNGEEAGSEGYARQVEAIEIRLVEKDSEAPGNTENRFYKK